MLSVVVAMQPEADPLIAKWQLKKIVAPYPLFSSDNINLIVSGIGKTQAAAATAWLAAYQRARLQNSCEQPIAGRQGCWLNVGIAGHSTEDIGKAFLAHKVRDHSTNKAWYPTLIKPTLTTCNLTTFDQPQSDYLSEELHDMEASGFVEAARRFSHAEFIHCVKIVSDNKSTPLTNITPASARQHVEDNEEAICNVSRHLLALHQSTNEHSPPTVLPDFLNQWQFSATQTTQLTRLLARYTAFDMPLLKVPESLHKCNNANQVLKKLTQEIDQQASIV